MAEPGEAEAAQPSAAGWVPPALTAARLPAKGRAFLPVCKIKA